MGLVPGLKTVMAQAAMGFQHHTSVRSAIRARQKLRVSLSDNPDASHILRPLELSYWGRLWMAAAWSETFEDFLTFRLDQVANLAVLPQLFVEEDGKTLADLRLRDTAPGQTVTAREHNATVTPDHQP